MTSLFRLPDEDLLISVRQQFPCRQHQISSLATLVWPSAVPCRNLILYGTEATGKSAVTSALLASTSQHFAKEQQSCSLQYAIVRSDQCITQRHLFERVVGATADALQLGQDTPGSDYSSKRVETLAQLAVELERMLKYPNRDPNWRFVLVLDGIDRQRDSSTTLIPGLASLSGIIPSLSTIFITTAPPAGFLRAPSSAHIHFAPYSKPEYITILAPSPPPIEFEASEQEVRDLWTRFCAATYDSVTKAASRNLTSFKRCCYTLWPRFTAPVVRGTHTVKEFSKLLVAARSCFQDESLLNPSIVANRSGPHLMDKKTTAQGSSSTTNLAALLPITARILLLCAYLASHNPSKQDLTLFSTYHYGRKRRRGGFSSKFGVSRKGPKHRKIARKLLGAHAFVLERMLAIFEAARLEWVEDTKIGHNGLDGDVGMALATLASLRLLTRVGVGGDVMDRAGKWRINVGWEVVRVLGRSMGVEVEEWLIE